MGYRSVEAAPPNGLCLGAPLRYEICCYGVVPTVLWII